MDFPEFPHDFSKVARANVIQAEIRASRAAVSGVPAQAALQRAWYGDSGGGSSLGKAALIVQYIMTVFAAFAHEACELGKKGNGWSVDVIDREAREHLRLITIHAVYKYSYVNFY